MKVKTAYSQKTTIEDIIVDIKNQIGSFDSKFIQFFASSNIFPDQISEALQNAFKTTPMIGCTTSGEIITGKMLDNSVVVMAYNNEIFSDLKIEVLTNISNDSKVVEKAFDNFDLYFKDSMKNLDPSKYLGIVLIDGLSVKEELINERIGDLTNISFIGGSAGDDLKFKKTHIFANGKTYENAAVLTLFKCNSKFQILKTQSFNLTKNKVIVTKANESTRTIIEINNKPAVEEYARLVGKTKENISEAFSSSPLGFGFEDNIYVRSPQRVDGNNIVFYCAIKEGMELTVLESTDMIEETKTALKNKINELGSVSAIVNYHCILRTLELKAKNITVAYGDLFKEVPTLGFSTYGESYIGHINQTSTMILFN